MKLLLLEQGYRQYLTSRGAIRLDTDGDEALVGLSRRESVGYLKLREGVEQNLYPMDLAGLSLFLSFHDRHRAALPDANWWADILDDYADL